MKAAGVDVCADVRANASNGGFDLARLRKKLGIKGAAVARELRMTPQGYLQLEESALAGTLNIGRLRAVFDILGFELQAIHRNKATAAPAVICTKWTPPDHYTKLPYEIDLDVDACLSAKAEAKNDLMPTKQIQANVRAGLEWARERSSMKVGDVLTEHFVCSLHREMFYRVFEQAGLLCGETTVFGVSHGRVREEFSFALTSAFYEIERQPSQTIALALHHQLATKALFAFGSTAHARAMADLVLMATGSEPFTWGETLAIDGAERVRRYRGHLLVPDVASRGGLQALAFARS